MNDVAPHEWSSLPPTRPPAPATRSVAPVVVPLAIVALFWLAGRRTLAVAVLVIAITVTAATSVSPRARDLFDRAARSIGHHVGRILTFALLGLVQVVIFAPVSLLARLTRTDPMDPLAGRQVETRWLTRSARERTLPRRPYGDEHYRRLAAGGVTPPGSPRWIRGVIGGLALLIFADVALGSLLVRLGRDDPDSLDGPVFDFVPTDQEALAEQPDSRELMADLEQAGLGAPDPFIGWRFGNGVTFESDQVTIVDGARRSATSSLDGAGAEVWFLGGSTMFGSGQSDGATIPSAIVATMDAAGIRINATNLGHPAYSQWQEVQLLEHELTSGARPSPDVVIFYDGFNELTLQTQFGVHDEPTHLFFGVLDDEGAPPTPSVASTVRTWWVDHSATALAAGRVRDTFDDEPVIQVVDLESAPIETIDPAAAADAAIAIHRRGVDHVTALSEAYGFEVRFFWQPHIYTRDPLTPAETNLVGLPGYGTDVWIPMTERVRDVLADPVIDLSDALDGEPTSLFWDFVHTNERGAALIAKAIQPHLIEALEIG